MIVFLINAVIQVSREQTAVTMNKDRISAGFKLVA